MPALDTLPEQELNPLLRRVDWRFLLPDPSPVTSICFSGGRLAKAVAAISENVRNAEGESHADCDLAVAVNPDEKMLKAVYTSLCPGGACYIEWYIPFIGHPKRVRRLLNQAGFEEVNCYSCWPLPDRNPLFWLPLEAPGGLNYFLRSRPPDSSFIRQVARTVGRTIWQLGLRSGLIIPVCATAQKPNKLPMSDSASVVVQSIQAAGTKSERGGFASLMQSGWSSWGLGATPRRLSRILLTGGRRSINKVVCLIFEEPDSQPRLAVKMARVPASIPSLHQEVAILRALEAKRPGGTPGVPRVLFCQEHPGLLTVGETALTGVSLFTQLKRDNYHSLALKATNWLVELASRSKPVPPQFWWSRLVEPVFTDFMQAFGGMVEESMVQETRNQLAKLGPLPLVCEHRDFSPWNVLLTHNGELVVLDWESAELEGLPTLDLIYFLTYLAFFLDGTMESQHFGEAYRALLNPDTLTGRITADCLGLYANRLNLDPSILHALRAFTWLLHARSEYRHFTADAGGRPAEETLRQSFFVNLWREELRHGATV